jgi:hypothetical protein
MNYNLIKEILAPPTHRKNANPLELAKSCLLLRPLNDCTVDTYRCILSNAVVMSRLAFMLLNGATKIR